MSNGIIPFSTDEYLEEKIRQTENLFDDEVAEKTRQAACYNGLGVPGNLMEAYVIQTTLGRGW